MKIGIIGGTFDPIHNGHLIIGEYIRDYLTLDEIVFIPAGQPPHKNGKYQLSAKHRFNMVSLAIENNPKFSLSDMEIKNIDISYTFNTIKKLKDENANIDYYFIIGADSLFNLHDWYRFGDLAKITKFALRGRLGHTKEEIENRIQYLQEKYDAEIIYIDGPLIEISSSVIRNRILLNKSIKYLLPDQVKEYIENNNLYIGENHESLWWT